MVSFPRQAVLFVLVLAIVPSAHPQSKEYGHPPEFSVSGVVADSVTGHPVDGALVVLVPLNKVSQTLGDGTFDLGTVPSGEYVVVVRMLGYADARPKITVDGEKRLTIRLAPEEVKVNAVTVMAERKAETMMETNHSVAYLSSDELDKVRGQTLGRSLEQIAGVTVLQTGASISKPVIRGLHSERIVVLNAGLQQEGQQWGGEHAPEIDPFAADRITVVRGASGIEYGAGAIGGVIRVDQRELPSTVGVGGEALLNTFSNNLQAAGSTYIEGMSSLLPGLAMRLQGSFRKAGSYSTSRYVVGNSGFEEVDGSFTAGYKGDDWSAEAYFSHFGTDLGIYKGSHIGSISDLERALAAGGPLATYAFSYEIKPPKQHITHDLWSVVGKTTIPSIGSVDVRYGWQSNHRQEYDAFRFFNNQQQLPTRAAFDMTLTTYSLDAHLHHVPVGGVSGTFGVTATRQGNVGEGTTFLIPNYRQYTGAAFLVESWAVGRVTFNAGGRYDLRWLHVYAFPAKRLLEQTHTYDDISAALGASLQLDEAWSIGGNLGTAFRPPGVNELFSDGVHHGSAEYERGDSSLLSERSLSADATLHYHAEKASFELSVYSNAIHRFIYLLPNPVPVLTLRGAFPYFEYKQNNAVLRGVDGSFELPLDRQWTAVGSFAVVRGTNVDKNQPLYQMPADRARLGIRYAVDVLSVLERPYVEVGTTGVRRQDRFPAGVDYVDPPPGYVLWDLGAGARVAFAGMPIDMHLSISNLFNTAYRDYLSRFRYFINDPGRDITFRLQMPFGTVQH